MKSVLISIQPYWVFLIIARLMGWNIPQEKTVEVRKDYPKDRAWNKRVHIYCSKNRKSFNRIPKEYQPLMEKLLGKVVGEFVCDRIYKLHHCIHGVYSLDLNEQNVQENLTTCLTVGEVYEYGKGKPLFGLHISDLKIYDKPKELGEFHRICREYGSDNPNCDNCKYFIDGRSYEYDESDCAFAGHPPLTRPPQSWQFVDEL